MPLRTETMVEYYFDNAYLYYCKQHDCLRVTNNHADSVLLNGVEQGDIDNFISSYIEYDYNADSITMVISSDNEFLFFIDNTIQFYESIGEGEVGSTDSDWFDEKVQEAVKSYLKKNSDPLISELEYYK